MSDLTGQRIDLTYDGLIHTETDQPVAGSLVSLQDGVGNNIGIQVAQSGGNFTTTLTSNAGYTNGLTVGSTGILFGGTIDFQTSSVDFTNSTIIGLPTSDTTYDLGAVGSAGNINIALSGSDGSNDVVSVQAGTNITLTDNGSNTFTIDATGGTQVTEFSSAYRNNIYSPTMGGYPANTFAKHMQPIVGRPFMAQSIDQNNDTTLFVRCYGEVGATMTTIVVPLYAGSEADVIVEIYTADATTGLPGTREYTESFTALAAEGFYEFTLATPQTMSSTGDWWVGVRTTLDRKLAQIGGDQVIHSMASWGGYGGSIGGFTPVNTFYYATNPVPATIPTNHGWSGRDELTMYFWK